MSLQNGAAAAVQNHVGFLRPFETEPLISDPGIPRRRSTLLNFMVTLCFASAQPQASVPNSPSAADPPSASIASAANPNPPPQPTLSPQPPPTPSVNIASAANPNPPPQPTLSPEPSPTPQDTPPQASPQIGFGTNQTGERLKMKTEVSKVLSGAGVVAMVALGFSPTPSSSAEAPTSQILDPIIRDRWILLVIIWGGIVVMLIAINIQYDVSFKVAKFLHTLGHMSCLLVVVVVSFRHLQLLPSGVDWIPGIVLAASFFGANYVVSEDVS